MFEELINDAMFFLAGLGARDLIYYIRHSRTGVKRNGGVKTYHFK